jgi:hypothetical protein
MRAFWEYLRREFFGEILSFCEDLFFEKKITKKCSALVTVHFFREKPVVEELF